MPMGLLDCANGAALPARSRTALHRRKRHCRAATVAVGAAWCARSRDHPVLVRHPVSWWLDERAPVGREHFEEQHARRKDAKEDGRAAEEICLLQEAGALDRTCSVVDIGAGAASSRWLLRRPAGAWSPVDVSPVMLERLAEPRREDAGNQRHDETERGPAQLCATGGRVDQQRDRGRDERPPTTSMRAGSRARSGPE